MVRALFVVLEAAILAGAMEAYFLTAWDPASLWHIGRTAAIGGGTLLALLLVGCISVNDKPTFRPQA